MSIHGPAHQDLRLLPLRALTWWRQRSWRSTPHHGVRVDTPTEEAVVAAMILEDSACGRPGSPENS